MSRPHLGNVTQIDLHVGTPSETPTTTTTTPHTLLAAARPSFPTTPTALHNLNVTRLGPCHLDDSADLLASPTSTMCSPWPRDRDEQEENTMLSFSQVVHSTPLPLFSRRFEIERNDNASHHASTEASTRLGLGASRHPQPQPLSDAYPHPGSMSVEMPRRRRHGQEDDREHSLSLTPRDDGSLSITPRPSIRFDHHSVGAQSSDQSLRDTRSSSRSGLTSTTSARGEGADHTPPASTHAEAEAEAEGEGEGEAQGEGQGETMNPALGIDRRDQVIALQIRLLDRINKRLLRLVKAHERLDLPSAGSSTGAGDEIEQLFDEVKAMANETAEKLYRIRSLQSTRGCKWWQLSGFFLDLPLGLFLHHVHSNKLAHRVWSDWPAELGLGLARVLECAKLVPAGPKRKLELWRKTELGRMIGDTGFMGSLGSANVRSYICQPVAVGSLTTHRR